MIKLEAKEIKNIKINNKEIKTIVDGNYNIIFGKNIINLNLMFLINSGTDLKMLLDKGMPDSIVIFNEKDIAGIAISKGTSMGYLRYRSGEIIYLNMPLTVKLLSAISDDEISDALSRITNVTSLLTIDIYEVEEV